jgi:hypothetical protein
METVVINEIRYTLLRRNWHPFGKILVSDVPGAFALNLQSRQERPPQPMTAALIFRRQLKSDRDR